MILACATMVLAPGALLGQAMAAWGRTPEMRVEDAYKWLYQASRGGEHAVAHDAGPRAWLRREWASLGPQRAGEREVEPLGPLTVRVHLRPYRARGGDPEMLLAAFVASAERFDRSSLPFEAAWRRLGQRLEEGAIGRLRLGDWRRLDRATRARGYPAIHHSEAYVRAYAPAYRVVLRSMW